MLFLLKNGDSYFKKLDHHDNCYISSRSQCRVVYTSLEFGPKQYTATEAKIVIDFLLKHTGVQFEAQSYEKAIHQAMEKIVSITPDCFKHP